MSVPTLHDEKNDVDYFLGKLSAKPLIDAVPFKEVRAIFVKAGGVLPTVPADWGHAGDFKTGSELKGGYGMLGNGPCDDGSIDEFDAGYQGAGDCAWAGPAHEEMTFAKNAGAPIPKFTSENILVDNYGPYCGYDIKTGANDQGSQISDVVKIRQTTGLVTADGEKLLIGQSFEGTPGDFQELVEMAYLLECAGIGVNLQQAQEDQFNDGTPWDYVAGSQDLGGHYVCVPGKRLITWAAPHRFTRAFFEHQNDELVGYVSPHLFSLATGKDAEGFDQADLEQIFTLLAQKQQAPAAA